MDRLYVPAATLVLLAVANWAVKDLQFDPWRVAQNPRLSIASAPVVSTASAPGFAVIKPLFPPDSPYNVLSTPIPPNSPRVLSILFAGNSQTIATMDEQPGDRYAPVWLSELLNGAAKGRGERFALRIGSEPNLRMSELLLKALLGTAERDRSSDVVIAGIVVDGLRWVDPREDIARLAQSSPPVKSEVEALLPLTEDLPGASRVVRQILGEKEFGAGPPSGAEEERKAERAAQSVEDALQASLDARVPLFRQRTSLYEYAWEKYVGARNRVLGVHTSTRRPIPTEMYSTNMQIIETMLRYLHSRSVHAVIYFAPIRPIEPNPTDPADTARFQKDLSSLCARYGALYLDYSNLIPEVMWTNYPDSEISGKAGERDFSHFTGRAHRRLGERLEADLRPHLERWLAEKSAALSARGPVSPPERP